MVPSANDIGRYNLQLKIMQADWLLWVPREGNMRLSIIYRNMPFPGLTVLLFDHNMPTSKFSKLNLLKNDILLLD